MLVSEQQIKKPLKQSKPTFSGMKPWNIIWNIFQHKYSGNVLNTCTKNADLLSLLPKSPKPNQVFLMRFRI